MCFTALHKQEQMDTISNIFVRAKLTVNTICAKIDDYLYLFTLRNIDVLIHLLLSTFNKDVALNVNLLLKYFPVFITSDLKDIAQTSLPLTKSFDIDLCHLVLGLLAYNCQPDNGDVDLYNYSCCI